MTAGIFVQNVLKLAYLF